MYINHKSSSLYNVSKYEIIQATAKVSPLQIFFKESQPQGAKAALSAQVFQDPELVSPTAQ